MDNFIIKKGNYLAAVDFGNRDDTAVEMIIKIIENRNYKIISSRHLGKSKDWDEQRKEEYRDSLQRIIYFHPEKLKTNELIQIFDNDDREIIKLLKEGDYVECYNGNRGIIVKINFPILAIKYFDIHINIHIIDIKSIKFNEEL